MNWAFELLGLRPDADAASVKRAYARLLRTTRPDEDPEAFQRLHAAYKMALAHADARPATSAEATVVSIKPLETPAPASSATTASTSQPPNHVSVSPAPALNLGVLANEIIRVSTEAKSGEALLRWLQNRPEFWSIQIKQQAGHLVLNRLFQQPQAMASDCLDVLTRFFDLDHVLSGINPIALQRLRARQRTLWELQPENHRELAKRMGLIGGGQPEISSLKQDIALLQHPFSWSGALRAALRLGRVREIGRLVQALLANGGLDTLPPTLDKQQVQFWYRAAGIGSYMTWPRFAMGSLHAAMAAAASALVTIALMLISVPYQPGTGISAISIGACVAAGVFALWLLYAGCIGFDRWQCLPESAPSRYPWLRRLAIPALCASGLALYEMGAPHYVEWLIAVSFIFAVRKFRRRTPNTNKLSVRIGSMMPSIIYIGIAVASAFSHMQDADDFPVVPVAAFATFGILMADLWRHRAYLRPRLARS